MQQSNTPTAWSTTSLGGTADTSPMELDALGEHLSACRGQQGRFMALRCAAQRLHEQLSTRMVTSLVVSVVLLIGVGSLLLRAGPG